MWVFKKKRLTAGEAKMKELKTELARCKKMMESSKSMFELAEEDDLIEARIYRMMSLAKHYDYLMGEIKRLSEKEERRKHTAVNV